MCPPGSPILTHTNPQQYLLNASVNLQTGWQPRHVPHALGHRRGYLNLRSHGDAGIRVWPSTLRWTQNLFGTVLLAQVAYDLCVSVLLRFPP